MQVEEIFDLTKELVDTNSNNQVTIDEARFVIFYNKAQEVYLRTILDNTRQNDKVQYAQKFLVPAKKLKGKPGMIKQEQRFQLPPDFVKREEIIVTGTKGECSDLMYVEEVKPSDITFLLTDEYHKPSFDFRESFYYIGDDSIVIYNDGNFKISDVGLVYYRQPKRIDMAGNLDALGNPTKTIETEWEDTAIHDIVEILVSRYAVAKLPIRGKN